MKIPVVKQRKICEFLVQGNTHRQIAKRVNVSPTTVGVIAKKLDEIQTPIAEVLKSSNQEFVDIVQTSVAKNIVKCKPLPDFTYINDQMKIRDMTLKQCFRRNCLLAIGISIKPSSNFSRVSLKS